jgi:arylsulfatase A-like enzyme
MDHVVGEFLDGLSADGTLERTVVVLGSDHGESFEHGWVGHGGPLLHESLLRIPLLIRFPKGPAGVRPKSFVTPLDLAPTLLGYLGLPVPPEMQGEDMAAYIKEPQKLSLRARLAISYFAYTDRPGEVAVYSDRFKVVFLNDRSRLRVYDLFRDPKEQHDLIEQYAEQARQVAESVAWPGKAEKAGQSD